MGKQKQPEYRINLRPYRFFYWPLMLPVALLLALFNKISPIPFKIYALRVDRIGQMAGNQEQYMAELECGVHPREFRIYIHRDKPCNSVLMDMQKRALPIHNIFLPLFDVCHKFGGLGISSIELLHYTGRDDDYLLYKTKPFLNFTQSEIDQARTECRKLEIDLDKPFIPVLARDPSYLDSIKEPTERNNYRNVDINTFVPAMEFLADKHKVFRMGSVVAGPLKSDHPNILDYSLSGKRSELLDVYLSANCRFFLTCGSGPDTITSHCFRQPVLYVNYMPPAYLKPMRKQCMAILKKYWDRNKKRYLSLEELLNSEARMMCMRKKLNPLGIEVHDNSPEEILEAAKEMEARLDGTWVETKEDKKNQEKFWAIYNACYGPVEHPCSIGAQYLRENLFWLD